MNDFSDLHVCNEVLRKNNDDEVLNKIPMRSLCEIEDLIV